MNPELEKTESFKRIIPEVEVTSTSELSPPPTSRIRPRLSFDESSLLKYDQEEYLGEDKDRAKNEEVDSTLSELIVNSILQQRQGQMSHQIIYRPSQRQC